MSPVVEGGADEPAVMADIFPEGREACQPTGAARRLADGEIFFALPSHLKKIVV